MSGAERWTIAMGDFFEFSIEHDAPRYLDSFGSNADLNGLFATKADALDSIIRSLEGAREHLARQIARAKRMRRAASAKAKGIP